MPEIHVKICKANNLAPRAVQRDVDPYVKLRLGREPKKKTRILGQTVNPTWDDTFKFTRWEPKDILVISVWNCKAISKNEFMGMLQFSYPDDETGRIKVTKPLLPDASNTSVQGSLTLEIVDVARARAWEKANPVTSEVITGPSQDEGSKALAQMQKGQKFQMLYGNMLYDVTLSWMDIGSKGKAGKMGQLYWSQVVSDYPVLKDMPHKILVAQVCDIFVGLPCPHAKHSKCKDKAEQCLAIADKIGTRFDLISKTNEQTDVWLEGLKYLLTSRGKKVVQNKQAQGASNNAAAPEAKKKGRRLTIEGNKAAPATFKGTITEQVSFMLQGFNVTQYTGSTDNPEKKPKFVFFSKRGGKFGSIHWCDVGDREEEDETCIFAHRISQLCVGKQRSMFAKCTDVDDELCVSIIAKEKELHMVVESVHAMKCLVIGLEHILGSNGRTVVLESKADKDSADKDRRFSRKFSVAVRAKSSHPGVLKMAKGAHFTRYRQKKSRPDRSVKTEVFVFHSSLLDKKTQKPVDAAGALFWYENKAGADTEAKKKDRHIIPIQSISDIYCGKQHEIFNTKCASDAQEERALSIKGMERDKDGNQTEFILHLEAPDEETVDKWMDGIGHLLQQGGREILELDNLGDGKGETQAAAPTPEAPTPTPGKKKKRMSVAPTAAAPAPKFDDPFESLGLSPAVEYGTETENLENFFPEERPFNPFLEQEAEAEPEPTLGDVDTLSDSWDPFAGVDVSAEPVSSAPMAVNNAAASLEEFNPFADLTAPAPAPAPTPAPTPAPASIPAGTGGIEEFLASLKLSQLLPVFASEEVDMDALREFTADDLTQMGIKAGPRVKILKNIGNWQ